MEAARGSLRQIRCSILFGFFFLFAMGVLVDGDEFLAKSQNGTSSAGSVAPSAEKSTLEEATTPASAVRSASTSKTHFINTSAPVIASEVPQSTTTEKNKLSSTESPKLSSPQPSKIAPVVTVTGKKTLPPILPATSIKNTTDATVYVNTTSISNTHTPAVQGTTGVDGNVTDRAETPKGIPVHKIAHTPSPTTGVSLTVTTVSEATSAATGPKSTPEQTKRRKETTPGQRDTIDHDPGSSVSTRLTTGMTATIPVSTATPRKSEKIPTVAIVLIILAALIVVAFVIICLVCRRRRHSGSTSFRTGGWAGQVALPDDSGLEKEGEKGTLTAAGEGEAKLTTLSTFSGKRRSRVSSVQMEEIGGKEAAEKEETQQLIGGDAIKDSSPGGPGEANGKVTKSTMGEMLPKKD
ncbi:mucin-2-like [Hemicordylus capensis]|uniref:mucin-2-like n=1 Tax=Hemicordylus capensis TaxID=884348 RepID=UPI002302CAAC|nr:mucin-2-like [Hemicordylus capensis]